MKSNTRAWSALAFLWAATVSAQPSIEHAGLVCVAPGRFAVVLSGIDPRDEIQTAKTYFRSSLFPDFYYVEMAYADGRFVGILPQPSPETSQIVYYLEAVDGSFNGTRSPEFAPVVQEQCDDRAGAAYLPTSDSGIVVGATTAGQSALPPGFSAAGIIGTIASTGVSSGVGGGIGAGVAVATAAGAAGVAGTVIATNPGSETTTSAPAAAVTSVTTTVGGATTTAPTTVPGQPTTTSSAPGPTTTTVGSGPSTTTSAGPSTTTSSGVSTTTTTPPSTSTTSNVPTTTTTAAAPLKADCFTVQVLGPCKVRVDATCVALPVDRYEWTLDQNDVWQRADFPDGPASFEHTFGNCGSSQLLKFKLKVHRGGSNDTSVQDFFVNGSSLKAPSDSSASLELETHLALPPFDGSARGRLLLDGAVSRFVESSQPVSVRVRAPSGANRIEAVVLQPGTAPGTWRFDFASEARLVRGSLRALEGNVLSIEPAAIVFRLEGVAPERLQFTFELDQ